MVTAFREQGYRCGTSDPAKRPRATFHAMSERVSRAQILAFRAAAQSLDRRRPATDLLHVAGACGVQDTPPGNAEVSLAARLDLDGPVVEQAVERRELVLTWSVRGAPHLFPPADFAVFTLGARPAPGTIEKLWRQPEDSLVEVERAMVSVIGDEPCPKGDVSTAVTPTAAAGADAMVSLVQGPPCQREHLPGRAAARAPRPHEHGAGAADQSGDVARG